MQGFLIPLALAAACGSREPWTDPPTSAEIIDLLRRNEALEIRAEQPGCDSVFGAPLPRFTVGRYVAFLLGTVAAEKDAGTGSEIGARCAPVGEAWACTMWVAVGQGGESPWSYGLRFSVSGDPPAIDPTSFSCPGGS